MEAPVGSAAADAAVDSLGGVALSMRFVRPLGFRARDFAMFALCFLREALNDGGCEAIRVYLQTIGNISRNFVF
jgi:hypothetical protein